MLEIFILFIIITIVLIFILNKEEITLDKKSEQAYKRKKKKKYTETLTLKEIANHFNTTQININKAFNILLYAQQSGKWWIVTKEGIQKGGIQQYNATSKQKYIIWEKQILKDYELVETIKKLTETKKKTTIKTTAKKYTKEWSEEKKKDKEKTINMYQTYKDEKKTKTTYKEKVQKGTEYEEYVAKVYRSRGYHVSEYGKQMGKEDHGIDLIAKKEKHLVLIQCKNWNKNGKWKVTHKEIKIFQTEARLFVEDKPLLRQCLLDARYAISGDFIHASALKHIEEIQKVGKRVDYEIIEMPIY